MNNEQYLLEMYESVERMNILTLEGDIRKIDEEREIQLQIKKKFFNTKSRRYSDE